MLHKRSAIKTPGGRDKCSSSIQDKEIKTPVCCDERINIEIPEALKKKRLEELTWKNLEMILVK